MFLFSLLLYTLEIVHNKKGNGYMKSPKFFFKCSTIVDIQCYITFRGRVVGHLYDLQSDPPDKFNTKMI